MHAKGLHFIALFKLHLIKMGLYSANVNIYYALACVSGNFDIYRRARHR